MVLNVSANDFRRHLIPNRSNKVSILPKLSPVHLSLHFRKLLKHNFCRYRLQLANDLRNRQPWGKRDKQMNVVLPYFQSVKFYVIPLPNLKK